MDELRRALICGWLFSQPRPSAVSDEEMDECIFLWLHVEPETVFGCVADTSKWVFGPVTLN